LPIVLEHANKPCLFWLDAHWSGGITVKGTTNTPIEKELYHILRHHVRDHVILVDDAHCFTGQDGYPTLQELRDLVGSTSAYASFQVRNDIIAVTKNQIPSETPVCSKTPDLLVFEALRHAYHATCLPSAAMSLLRSRRSEEQLKATSSRTFRRRLGSPPT
jgi:hypothetical protein